MASGHWSETDRPIRPGFYNRFKAAALARITMGKSGIVAMPVKSNWGPVKEIVRVTGEKSLIDNFGGDMKYTAYKLGRLALLGQPKELLLYRLVDGKQKTATLELKGVVGGVGESKPVIKVETKYPTTRNFRVTIKPNITNEALCNLILYEGAKPLYEFKNLPKKLNEIEKAINENIENKWLVATSLEGESEATLDNLVTAELTGGNDGTGAITSKEYIEALDAYEGVKINGISLDGVTDSAIHTSLKGWIERNRKAGKKVRGYIGGTLEESSKEADNRSESLNYEGMHNVTVGGILDGIKYSPAETAVYIMALGEGQDAKECLCNQTTVFQDVTRHLGHEEIEDALLSGSLVLRFDDGAVVVEDDKNTLTRYGQDQNETWGYLRAIKFMDMVDEDTSLTGNRQYVGKVLNGTTGKLAVLSALTLYFETLLIGGLIENFEIGIDEELQATASDDEFFWEWGATYINVMKKIFSTGHIK